MRTHYPNLEFKASIGWLYRFTRRNRISWRRKTNIKQKAPFDKLAEVRRFHREFLAFLKTGENLDETYGRFPLENRFNVDQVPCAFLLGMDYTWADTNSERVWVKGCKNAPAMIKRQCTLQICYSATGKKAMPELRHCFFYHFFLLTFYS